MKKNEMEKIFNKLNLKVRVTGHNCGWFVVEGLKGETYVFQKNHL